MSRSRTPVDFPRMKVRGARNRAKSAERVTQVWKARVRVVKADLGSVRLVVDPLFGTHVVQNAVVRDGWGRTVAA